MSTEEIDTHDRISKIEGKLMSLDRGIDEYFDNYNLQQLEHVLNKADAIEDATNRGEIDFSEYRSRDINEFVEICNQLWIIHELIKESDINSDFIDKIDNCQKLETKLNSLKHSVDQELDANELKIIKELNEKLQNYKTEIREDTQSRIKEYITHTDKCLTMSNLSRDLSFLSFLVSAGNFFDEDVKDVLNITQTISDWLEISFSSCDEGKSIVYFKEDDKYMLKIQESDNELLTFVSSIEHVILFMDEVSKSIDNVASLSNTRIIIGKLLLKQIKTTIFRKENVYPLIIDKLNYSEGSKISSIAKLYQISSMLSEDGWSQDGICELEFWIDDLTSFWVNNLADCTIDEIKELVTGFLSGEYSEFLEEQNLVCISLGANTKDQETKQDETNEWNENWEEKDDWNEDEQKNEKTEQEINLVTNHKEAKVDEDDDGGWGNDDLDLDLDDEEIPKQEVEEDGWDAWNEDLDISDDEPVADKEVTTQPQETTKPSNIPCYKHTKLVEKLLLIFSEKYYKNIEDLTEFGINREHLADIEELLKHGFKKLCISYFMMIEADLKNTYKNPILFYNDFNKIIEYCSINYGVELSACHKMNLHSLNQFIDKYSDKLITIIVNYEDSVWGDNDLKNKEINEMSFEFMNEFDTKFGLIVKDLEKSIGLNNQLVGNFFITMIFKSFNMMCNKIISRQSISSYESSVISDIIDHIIVETKDRTKSFNIQLEGIQSLTKLRQIRFILTLNLKEILESFYDAKFYELETFELISLIKSLFMDSMQREQTINEIKIIRENA